VFTQSLTLTAGGTAARRLVVGAEVAGSAGAFTGTVAASDAAPHDCTPHDRGRRRNASYR